MGHFATTGSAFRPDQLQEILSGIDIGVVPSVCEETYGMGAAEFLRAGIPVIASRIGGIPEGVREGEGGILIPAGDAAAMVAVLDRVVGDGTVRGASASRVCTAVPFDEHLGSEEAVCREAAGPGK